MNWYGIGLIAAVTLYLIAIILFPTSKKKGLRTNDLVMYNDPTSLFHGYYGIVMAVEEELAYVTFQGEGLATSFYVHKSLLEKMG